MQVLPKVHQFECPCYSPSTNFVCIQEPPPYFGLKELLNESKIRPLVLKTDSDATVDIGIARISLAMKDKMLYLLALSFHQSNISNDGVFGLIVHQPNIYQRRSYSLTRPFVVVAKTSPIAYSYEIL